MKYRTTDRGFGLVESRCGDTELFSVQESSQILNYPDSKGRPGSSALWIGLRDDRAHLDREQVAELVNHLQAWLKTGSLEIK